MSGFVCLFCVFFFMISMFWFILFLFSNLGLSHLHTVTNRQKAAWSANKFVNFLSDIIRAVASIRKPVIHSMDHETFAMASRPRASKPRGRRLRQYSIYVALIPNYVETKRKWLWLCQVRPETMSETMSDSPCTIFDSIFRFNVIQ